MEEIRRLRDKYNIEGAAPAHLSGDERVLWGIFKEIDTDESGEVSKQELYAAFAKMGLVASAAEMLRLFREGDTDGNGRIDCDEFIALGSRVDVEDHDDLQGVRHRAADQADRAHRRQDVSEDPSDGLGR